MTNLLKSRDIIFLTKACIVEVLVFPVVMYVCESWTIKKAELQRIDAFKLLEKSSRESLGQQGDQSIIKEISHETKRCLLLGRKTMTNVDSILSRDITLPTKVHLVKAMVFPVVMYGCESWTIKKAEWRRINAFALWCWRRLLRVP